MTTWGVLRLPGGSVPGGFETGDGAVGAAVADRLDGAVALGHDVPLAVALASLPEQVDIVVELDAQDVTAQDVTSGRAGELIARLIAELDTELEAGLDTTHAAVVAARPVADALKQVEEHDDGDVVTGGVDRDGLFAPCLPHVYRRATLTDVLAAATDGDTDVLRAIIDAGHAVRVVPLDGSPARSLRPDRSRR